MNKVAAFALVNGGFKAIGGVARAANKSKRIVAVPRSVPVAPPPPAGGFAFKADTSVQGKIRAATDGVKQNSNGIMDAARGRLPLRGHPKFNTPAQTRQYLGAYNSTKFNMANPQHAIGQLGFKAQKAFHNPAVQLMM